MASHVAWGETAEGDAPRPKPGPPRLEKPARLTQPTPILADLPSGTTVRKLNSAGTSRLDKVTYIVGGQDGFQYVLVVTDSDKIVVTDLDGVILIAHTRPAPGLTYVGNGRPRGPRPKTTNRHRSLETPTVTDVLRHHSWRILEGGDD